MSPPASSPVAGSTPAVPPIVMNRSTLATWLYGPIGVGVFGGVRVSTLGMWTSDCGRRSYDPKGQRPPRVGRLERPRQRGHGLGPGPVGSSFLAGLGLATGGVASWVLGRRWNARGRDHWLFPVPVEWWGVAMVIGGLTLAVAGLLGRTGPT